MKLNFDTSKLKQQVEENPLVAAGIGAALLNGVAKLSKARTEAKNSKTYRKEINRRIKNSKN